MCVPSQTGQPAQQKLQNKSASGGAGADRILSPTAINDTIDDFSYFSYFSLTSNESIIIKKIVYKRHNFYSSRGKAGSCLYEESTDGEKW